MTIYVAASDDKAIQLTFFSLPLVSYVFFYHHYDIVITTAMHAHKKTRVF